MNVSLLPYVITLFLTGLLAFGVMIVAVRRSAVAGARSIAILMGALTIWSIAYGFEIGSTSLVWKTFWIKVQYFGIVTVPVAWFCFAFQYNGRGKWINSRTVLYLLIEPVLMLLLVWTNEIHGWVWGEVTLVPSQAGEILILTHNFAFYLNLIYAYFLTVIGSLSIVRKYLESPPLFKRQMSLILIAALFPFSANILYISGFRPFLFLDLTPFGFAFAGIAATWGLMRLKLLDVIPVARHTLLDVMDEGVIVVDAHERIVDINRSGLQMLNLEVGEVIGKYAGDVLQVWDRLKSAASDSWMRSSFEEEISLDKPDGRSSHYVRIRPLGGAQDPIAGCMLLWSDITDRKRMEDALRHSEEIHRQSLMRSPNPIFSVDRRGLIQFWNPACETNFLFGQEILGKDFRFLITSTQKLQEIDNMLEEAFENQASSSAVELPFRTQSGQMLYMSSRVYPVSDANGTVVYVMFSNTDVTQRRHTENKLRRQLEELSVLHAVASACVEASDEDQIIESVTEIISNSIYTVNFGVMLVDEVAGVLRFHPSYRGLPEELIRKATIRLGEGVTGRVACDGVPHCVQDVLEEPAYINLHQNTHSELCVPIKLAGKVFGVINAEDKAPNAFNENDERLLVTLAGQIAIAIENARLFKETQLRTAHLEALNAVIAAAAAETKLDRLLQTAIEHMMSALQIESAGIRVGRSYTARRVTEQQLLTYYSIIQESGLQLNEPLVVEDWSTQPQEGTLAPLARFMEKENYRSSITLGIFVEGTRLGGFALASETVRLWSKDEINLLKAISHQLGAAVERLRLFTRTQEHAGRMALLAKISAPLSRVLTVQEVLVNAGRGALTLTGADRAAVFIRTSADDAQCGWSDGLSKEYLRQVTSRAREMPGGKLFELDAPVLIGDTSLLDSKSPLKKLAEMENYQGIGLWPLVYEGEVIAALGCYFNQPAPRQDLRREVMLAYCQQAAIALQNARLFEETRRRAAQMEALNAIIAAGTEAPDVETLLERAMQVFRSVTGVEMAAVWVAGYSVMHGFHGDAQDFARYFSWEDLGIFNETIIVLDWEQMSTDHPMAQFAGRLSEMGMRSSIFVPLLVDGKRTGGLGLASTSERVWLDEEISLIEAVGRQLGSAAERLRLLEKIQGQALQMKQIMDTVPEGVLLLDPMHRILLANPAAKRYLVQLSPVKTEGQTLSELAGQPIEHFLQHEDSWSEIETGKKLKSIFAVAAQSLLNGDGSDGWVLVLRDKTQERENQQRIQIQERLATVGQLAAGIAHDFNNIMAAIVVYTELLMLEPGVSPEGQERLAIIQQQIQRAASLIRQILDFSRRSVMEHAQLDVLPFIKELDKLLARVLPETIRVKLSYQPGIYLINADPTRLQQVFMNLALNSRDAMPSGGELTFELDRIEVLEDVPAPMPDMSPGEWVRVRVRDTGCGIPKHIRDHIFEPFFTTKPVGQGTGLGLAQVYGIIKQHEGNIDVSSEPGKGTEFTIYLPVVTVPEQVATIVGKQTGYLGGAGERIIIVEDDWAARDALSTLLKSQGYQTLEAKNGVDALNVLKSKNGDVSLIISDIVMPEMGGLELYQHVSQNLPDIRFLLITGHPIDDQSQLLLERGAVAWMQKPFSGKEFRKVVRKILDGVAN